ATPYAGRSRQSVAIRESPMCHAIRRIQRRCEKEKAREAVNPGLLKRGDVDHSTTRAVDETATTFPYYNPACIVASSVARRLRQISARSSSLMPKKVAILRTASSPVAAL